MSVESQIVASTAVVLSLIGGGLGWGVNTEERNGSFIPAGTFHGLEGRVERR